MFLSKEKIQLHIQEYINEKKAQNLPWDTMEYDYLLKDLHADIWNEKGDLIKESNYPPLPEGSQWKSMDMFPQDGKSRLIKTTTGIVDGWYAPEEDNTGYFEQPGEGYIPPCLVCYDDEIQIEAEYGQNGYYFPEALGWMEIPE